MLNRGVRRQSQMCIRNIGSCGFNVSGNELKIDIEGNAPKELRIKLSGIRKGSLNNRFDEFTYEEMVANNAFWMQWKDKQSGS